MKLQMNCLHLEQEIYFIEIGIRSLLFFGFCQSWKRYILCLCICLSTALQGHVLIRGKSSSFLQSTISTMLINFALTCFIGRQVSTAMRQTLSNRMKTVKFQTFCMIQTKRSEQKIGNETDYANHFHFLDASY